MLSLADFTWKACDQHESEILSWQFRGRIWHSWELHKNDVFVASLKSKRFFTILFDGSFDGSHLLIKKSLNGQVKITLSESKSSIGELNWADPVPVTLKMADGSTYIISNPDLNGKFIFSDTYGRNLAITKFDNAKSFAISATYEVIDIRANDPNPWLVAIITLYIAIANSYSNP